MGDGDARELIRRDLELFWDSKLQRARERYFKAAIKLSQQMMDRGGEAAEQDSAVAAMRREEAETFADYCRILATHTELVAMGKLPSPRANLLETPRDPH